MTKGCVIFVIHITTCTDCLPRTIIVAFEGMKVIYTTETLQANSIPSEWVFQHIEGKHIVSPLKV